MKPVYFISDAHLGSWALKHRRTQERRLVRFLDEIKHNAAAVYMLGDMFDFWHEWHHVVPRGYTRFLGKISELTDMGIEVHYFIGNHDIWAYDYLRSECGVTLHRHAETVEIYGREFFLAHGDGLGDPDKSFKILRRVFRNKTCQWLFRNLIHPNLAMRLGMTWARNSRLKHDGPAQYLGEQKEHLVGFAKKYSEQRPTVDYLLFGHRHIELDLILNARKTRMLILGDWITLFTYAVWDGDGLFLGNYVEGESRL